MLTAGITDMGMAGSYPIPCSSQCSLTPTGLSPSPLLVCPEHLSTGAVAHGGVRATESPIRVISRLFPKDKDKRGRSVTPTQAKKAKHPRRCALQAGT